VRAEDGAVRLDLPGDGAGVGAVERPGQAAPIRAPVAAQARQQVPRLGIEAQRCGRERAGDRLVAELWVERDAERLRRAGERWRLSSPFLARMAPGERDCGQRRGG
jgi:hypothetical protein